MSKQRPRRFDHDEAARLHAEGATYKALGERYGVSDMAIKYACDPDYRALKRSYNTRRRGICAECEGPCGKGRTRCHQCASESKRAPLRSGSELRPSERRDFGATITVADLRTDQTETFALTGLIAGEAVEQCVRELRRRNAGGECDWRVVCISTPPTIYRDLTGYRIQLDGPGIGALSYPEETMLAKANATDLLKPRDYTRFAERDRKIA